MHGLTDSLELVFEVGVVLAVGDAEVVVGVVVLEHAARRVRCADCKHGRRAVRALRVTDLLDGCHGRTYVDR